MQATRRNIQLELALEPAAKGEARSAGARGTEARMARAEPERPAAGQEPSMEAVVEPGNLKKALARVRRNKGAPGVDGMTVDELGDHLKTHWPEIRSRLLAGSYTPQPVRRVEIPKASGGVRLLGVPTVLDRFIQQAVMQVLQEEWDPGFSDASYGFRPGRSAHQAVRRAQEHILAGFDIVVDLDLEKFFDRVNHDILMGLVAKRVADKRLLRLIRGFLTAGVLDGGLVGPTTKGTPQGGPLTRRLPPFPRRGGAARDGIELIQRIPQLADLPVIFISGYGRDETIARALELGAADYIVKPFSPTELTARVRAALRKRAEPERFQLGDLAIDYEQRKVTVAGQSVQLTASEYELLRLLSVNAGRVLPPETLLRQVRGGRDAADSTVVRTLVKKLRRKLGDDAAKPAYILTERGVGYRIATPADP